MLENLKARLGTRTLILIGLLAVVAVFGAAFLYLSATQPAKVKTLNPADVAPAAPSTEQPIQKFDAAPMPQAVNGSGLPGAPETQANATPATAAANAPAPAAASGPKEIPVVPPPAATPAPAANTGPSEIPISPAPKETVPVAAPAPKPVAAQAPAATPTSKPAAAVQAPAPKTPVPASTPASVKSVPSAQSTGGNFLYVYQVASYKDAAQAKNDKDRLDKAGLKARIEQADVNGGTWNRVRTEFSGSAEQLKEFTAKLRQAGFKNYIQISRTPAK